MTHTIHARRYDTDEPVTVTINGDRIAAIEPFNGTSNDPLAYIAPGFFDLQINGYAGVWFSDDGLTPEKVIDVLEALPAHGITRVCPTLITAPFDALVAGFTAIRETCEQHAWADRMIAGCHLEGPYISAEDGPRGAHPAEQVRPADWDEFERLQQAADGRIKLVTLAPEVTGAVEFIRRATAAGVVIAVGHTAANTEQIEAAVDAGARLSTHLGNGAHGTLRRHPNYIWDQLGEPRLMASIITDGHHLPPSVVRSFIAAKGIEGIILTCDASGLAGSPPGEYVYHGVRVEVLEDGPIVLAGQRQLLAGSGALTDVCVAKAITTAHLKLVDACDMAGRIPAALLGCDDVSLSVGSRADLIVFEWQPADERLSIRQTFCAGEERFTI